jgi:hypothetical protein
MSLLMVLRQTLAVEEPVTPGIPTAHVAAGTVRAVPRANPELAQQLAE